MRRVAQLGLHCSHFGDVLRLAGSVLKAHQVCRRAVEFQAHLSAVDGDVQAGNTVLMGTKAAVFLVAVSQGIDAEWKGKTESGEMAAHDEFSVR